MQTHNPRDPQPHPHAAHFHDISDLAEDDSTDEPSLGAKIGLGLSGLIAVVDAAALIAKVDLGKKVPFKWWFLWLVFVLSAGLFFYLLNMRRKEEPMPPKPDIVDLSHMNLPKKEEKPPVLDLPVEKVQKKMDPRARDVWEIVSNFYPQPPAKDFSYQDQLFMKLKKSLLQKYMVTPEFKRLAKTKADILVDREIAVEAKEATPEVVEKMLKRLTGMRVEYKQIIVVLFDKGRVPHSQIDKTMEECMRNLKEVVAYRVVKA